MLLSSVPVIVITANDDADAELTCLNLGASDFIRKPYNRISSGGESAM